MTFDYKALALKHKTDSRDKLNDAQKSYREMELTELTEKIIRQAGGRNVSPEYLKELAASLYGEATKREPS